MAVKNLTTIYLVDDDPVFCDMFEDYFIQHGDLRVQTFDCGEKCLEHMDTAAPDVLVLDYCLDSKRKQNLNGLEILKLLLEKHPDVRVVMLSAAEDNQVAGKTLDAGALYFVSKGPDAFKRLEMLIANLVMHEND